MRNLFLLLVVIVCFLFLKEIRPGKPAPAVKQEKLQPLYIEKSQTINSTGVIFLPVTIQLGEEVVKPKYIALTIAGTFYLYKSTEGFKQLYLLQNARAKEVPVVSGDVVRVTGTDSVKLFFAEEV